MPRSNEKVPGVGLVTLFKVGAGKRKETLAFASAVRFLVRNQDTGELDPIEIVNLGHYLLIHSSTHLAHVFAHSPTIVNIVSPLYQVPQHEPAAGADGPRDGGVEGDVAPTYRQRHRGVPAPAPSSVQGRGGFVIE